ncbi:MAG TPA: Rrf2 family transcriptional regulator [Acidimicrobiia bacterium]|nr:Rrf2 family transcriptional regulator [Acidimicrobiia bacterium]
MQMSLGKRADYAVRAVLDMTKHWQGGTRRKSRLIAQDMDIPAKYLPQVLAALVKAGLVESETGPEGGYRLTSAPERLTLLEVIEAVEGPLESSECVLRGGPCHWDDSCAIHESWSGAQDAMRQRLQETTFGHLLRVDEGLESRRR